MANRDKILRYCRNMQDIFDVALVALFVEWDILDILNGMNYVIPNFYIVRSFKLS